MGKGSLLTQSSQKTSLGVTDNVGGLLAYLLGWLSGLILLFVEPKNDFIRFHAVQSILVSIAWAILSLLFRSVPIFGWLGIMLLMPVAFILWIFLMYKAYQGERYKLPILGDLSDQFLNKPPQA